MNPLFLLILLLLLCHNIIYMPSLDRLLFFFQIFEFLLENVWLLFCGLRYGDWSNLLLCHFFFWLSLLFWLCVILLFWFFDLFFDSDFFLFLGLSLWRNYNWLRFNWFLLCYDFNRSDNSLECILNYNRLRLFNLNLFNHCSIWIFLLLFILLLFFWNRYSLFFLRFSNFNRRFFYLDFFFVFLSRCLLFLLY